MTKFKSPPKLRIPGYQHNAVLQLIVVSGVGYIAFLFTAVCFQAFAHYRFQDAIDLLSPYIALPSVSSWGSRFWTLLTYGWSHYGFWDWASNMIWLYAFGGMVQTLIGYRQIIPMFIYSLVAGGVCYLLVQLIPDGTVSSGAFVLGAQAGVTAFAVAALTLSPRYRLYLSDTFSIPLPVLAGIFAVLMLLRTNLQIPYLAMIAGGGLMGFLYVRLLRSGYKPGDWMYTWKDYMNRMFTPADDVGSRHRHRRDQVLIDLKKHRGSSDEQRIDDLLDKINRHGYESLTADEKETLVRASKK